jgi:hypothetical protein
VCPIAPAAPGARVEVRMLSPILVSSMATDYQTRAVHDA